MKLEATQMLNSIRIDKFWYVHKMEIMRMNIQKLKWINHCHTQLDGRISL